MSVQFLTTFLILPQVIDIFTALELVSTVSGVDYTSFSNAGEFVTLGTPQVLIPGATDVTKTTVTLNVDLNSTGGVSYTTGSPFSGSTAPGMLMMDGNDYNADGTADTTDANLVNGTGWKDKSGNGRDATTTGGDPRFMSNQLNGLGVIDFDGNDKVYVSNDAHSLAAHTDAFSAFLLVRMTDIIQMTGPAYSQRKIGIGIWALLMGIP